MRFMTHHGTYLAANSEGLFQESSPYCSSVLHSGDEFELVGQLRKVLPDAEIMRADGSVCFIRHKGAFVSAIPDGTIEVNRTNSKEWETFRFTPDFYTGAIECGEGHRFASAIEILKERGEPVKVHFACGIFPIPGFLNVDLYAHSHDTSVSDEEMFAFPTVGVRIPVPDNSVDFIFHEDFIEHISQLEQIQFLAEALRIMKPGAVHRVNTPNLLWTMETRSDFSAGAEGVYTGEREWQHIGIFTPSHLEEVAKMIGYREVHFTLKGESISPHAIPDRRPFGDRDEVHGNIYADLVK